MSVFSRMKSNGKKQSWLNDKTAFNTFYYKIFKRTILEIDTAANYDFKCCQVCAIVKCKNDELMIRSWQIVTDV